MEEKIGMEKLIELLNKFYKEEGDIFRAIQHNDRLEVFELENDDLVRDTAIISKHYGFIKWLVENDKIDRDKILKENGLFRKYFYDLEYVKNYDRLVMWLSVEDEPINFLVSILK